MYFNHGTFPIKIIII